MRCLPLWFTTALLAACGGAASNAPDSAPVRVPQTPSPLTEESDVLPVELNGLSGHMTPESVEAHLQTELDCGTDLCGGDVPWVYPAPDESAYSHYELYFDIDGARPLYQVIGMPRLGEQQEPMLGLEVGEDGVALQTADGHTLRVHREGHRTVWTWERVE